ncbi:serine/threonine-protein kinase pim-2-like [Alosa alosa]|uniref:serine/threonine-protein kinase pim-2-like n=1 Tax=Alosa alosa TaxID=278164 RepID=UPI0020151C40|nr:serine/threonine-protein kinase pim-2-like [Alosa alosa]
MWPVFLWLCEALLRMNYGRDNTAMSSSKEAPPSPVSACRAEQAIRRKRHLRRSVEGDRKHWDRKHSDGVDTKKQRQEKRPATRCRSDDSPVGSEGKVNEGSGSEVTDESYELDRHCRLAFGPALGTRSMTRWRAANGIVNHAEIHNIHYRSYDRSHSTASVFGKQPQDLDKADSKTLTGIERFEAMFSKGELIGHGGYGSVYAGYRKSDHFPVALKVVDLKRIKMWAKMSEFDEPIPLEIALLRQVCRNSTCKGIAKLLDYVELPGAYVMVLERPEPCLDLFNYMQEGQGYLEEAMSKHMMQQLVRVLLHCHSRGVVHRDLKPENILVEMTTRRIRLLDFGSASVLKEGQYTDIAGTPEYFPPETVLRGEYFAIPATVWSLGILLFQMLWGDVPFYNQDAIVKGTLFFPRGISRECRHLIRLCLTVNPKDRPTLEQILVHPWML